jgi:hypothetical protein
MADAALYAISSPNESVDAPPWRVALGIASTVAHLAFTFGGVALTLAKPTSLTSRFSHWISIALGLGIALSGIRAPLVEALRGSIHCFPFVLLAYAAPSLGGAAITIRALRAVAGVRTQVRMGALIAADAALAGALAAEGESEKGGGASSRSLSLAPRSGTSCGGAGVASLGAVGDAESGAAAAEELVGGAMHGADFGGASESGSATEADDEEEGAGAGGAGGAETAPPLAPEANAPTAATAVGAPRSRTAARSALQRWETAVSVDTEGPAMTAAPAAPMAAAGVSATGESGADAPPPSPSSRARAALRNARHAVQRALRHLARPMVRVMASRRSGRLDAILDRFRLTTARGQAILWLVFASPLAIAAFVSAA